MSVNRGPKDPTPNKVKIDRRSAAGLAVHDAYEACLEKNENLWTIKSFELPVQDTSKPLDNLISLILPSHFLCNPFIHVELFGKNLNIKQETDSYGAPRRDEFIFDTSIGRILDFDISQLQQPDNENNNNDNSEEKDNKTLDEKLKDMYLVIQILDDEGSQGRDRVIGESIITLSHFDFESNINYLELSLYEPRNLKYCGSLQLTGKCSNEKDVLTFEFNGIHNFRDDNAHLVKDDTYTEKRNDLIILLLWVIYMLTACFLYMWLEGFAFGTCLYIRVVTAFTVGYGDVYPITRPGKILNMFFIIIDTITLGYIAGKVMKYIIAFREKKAKENENAELDDDEIPSNSENENGAGGVNGNTDGNVSDDELPGDVPRELGSRQGSKQKSGDGRQGSRIGRQSSVAKHVNYQGPVSAGTNVGRMHDESAKTKRKLMYIGVAVLGYVIVGTLFYWLHEGWTFAESFEWNFVTLSTVGYGNITPTTDLGRVFTAFYIITGVTTLAYFATTAFEYIEDKKAEAFREQMISGALINEAQLLEFDQDGDGSIDKYEFLSKMVVMTGECEQEKVDEIMKKFNELDEDGGGTISVEELRKFEATS